MVYACAAWSAFALATEDEDALTNVDIIRLTEAGIAASVIVAKIEASATDFETSVDDILSLSRDGVDDTVVAAMVAVGGPSVAPDSETAHEKAPAKPPQRRKATSGSTFRDALSSGGEGPEMVVIPAGSFRMGCQSYDHDCRDPEKPVHGVTFGAPFALSVYEVTFEDYDRFTYPEKLDDWQGWGRGARPVIHVSWNDAQDYVKWLSVQTGAEYRLPSEAEWEYAARAGSTTKYSWGNELGRNRANCGRCGSQWDGDRTAPVGSFRPNGFGLHDMHGNVAEWVQDCRNDDYAGAPSDGAARLQGDCGMRAFRGGDFSSPNGWHLRAARRHWLPTDSSFWFAGFRVARTLPP